MTDEAFTVVIKCENILVAASNERPSPWDTDGFGKYRKFSNICLLYTTQSQMFNIHIPLFS